MRADAGKPYRARSGWTYSTSTPPYSAGDLDELRARANAGDPAAHRLADVLAGLGRTEEAEQLRRFGLNPDGSIASA
jgi:hypothetical protein